MRSGKRLKSSHLLVGKASSTSAGMTVVSFLYSITHLLSRQSRTPPWLFRTHILQSFHRCLQPSLFSPVEMTTIWWRKIGNSISPFTFCSELEYLWLMPLGNPSADNLFRCPFCFVSESWTRADTFLGPCEDARVQFFSTLALLLCLYPARRPYHSIVFFVDLGSYLFSRVALHFRHWD